jgi:hypothetical protein
MIADKKKYRKRVPSIVFYPTHKFDEKNVYVILVKINAENKNVIQLSIRRVRNFHEICIILLYPGTLVSHSRYSNGLYIKFLDGFRSFHRKSSSGQN